MSGRRYGSDKEISAVIFNIKEQRCLEKSLQTLSLEKTYSLKLLDLDHRIIRVNYRKLKDKVSRIKSNLSPDEIKELRRLDAEGKLKPTYNSVNISGALKIAAAARRLNVRAPVRDRAASSHPRLSGRHSTPVSTLPGLCRSNSVIGVFIDEPPPEKTRRRESVGVVSHDDHLRPFSAFTVVQDTFQDKAGSGLEARPATTSCVGFEKPRLRIFRPSTGASSNGHGHTHSPFSSHSVAGREQRNPSALSAEGPYSTSRETKLIYTSDTNIDSNLGEDLYEGRRQDMLDDELLKAEQLQHRKQDFLQDIDEYLRKTSLTQMELEHALGTPEVVPGDRAVSAGVSSRVMKRRTLKVDFDHTPTFAHEADYRRRLFDLWKDMNKCRYLRVPDELIDLSGIATLAKDQMRLFDVLKQTDQNSLSASAEL